MPKDKFIDIAEKWLSEHYPKELDINGIDKMWSAVRNFALYLDEEGNKN